MLSARLSEHFTLAEFTRSSHGDIPNVPTAIQIERMRALCDHVLEPLRSHFQSPVIILSGFRSRQLNRAVGGNPKSQHMNGEAADIRILAARNEDVWQFIRAELPFDQLIAEQLRRNDGAAGWVHVSYGPRSRRDAISYLGNRKHVPGLAYAG